MTRAPLWRIEITWLRAELAQMKAEADAWRANARDSGVEARKFKAERDAANALLRRCRVAVEQLNERFRCDGLLRDIDAHIGDKHG